MIPFTQYLLPHGRQITIGIDMPDEIEKKAEALLDQGFYFDIEQLRTGEISLTCEHPRNAEFVILVLSPNGPEIVAAVTGLVNQAYNHWQMHLSRFPLAHSQWREVLKQIQAHLN